MNQNAVSPFILDTDGDVVPYGNQTALKPLLFIVSDDAGAGATVVVTTSEGAADSGTIPADIVDRTSGKKVKTGSPFSIKHNFGGHVFRSAGSTLGAVAGVNTGDGEVADLVIEADAPAEVWTLTCVAEAASTPDGTGNTGNGTMTAVTPAFDAPSETWTLVCTVDTGSGDETWSVTGSVSGAQATATTDVPYDNGIVAFEVEDGVVDYIAGDEWTFTVTARHFTVVGSVSGADATAPIDVAYDGDELAFTIEDGDTPFEAGDVFTVTVAAVAALIESVGGNLLTFASTAPTLIPGALWIIDPRELLRVTTSAEQPTVIVPLGGTRGWAGFAIDGVSATVKAAIHFAPGSRADGKTVA